MNATTVKVRDRLWLCLAVFAAGAGVVYLVTAILWFMSGQMWHGIFTLLSALGFALFAVIWFHRGFYTLHVVPDGIRREGFIGWTATRDQIVTAEIRKVWTIFGPYSHLLVSLDPDTSDKPDMFAEIFFRFKLPRDPYLVVAGCPADLDLTPLEVR